MNLKDFDDWARITAQLRLVPGPKRPAFLARLKCAATWRAADAEHKAALVEALAGGDMEHAFRLNRICDEVTTAGVEALALDSLRGAEPAAPSPANRPSPAKAAPSPAKATPSPAKAPQETAAETTSPQRAPKAPARDDFRHNVLYGTHKTADRSAAKGPLGGSFRALVKGGGASVEPPNAILRQTIPIAALSNTTADLIRKAASQPRPAPDLTPATTPSGASASPPRAEEWGSGPLAAFDWKLEQYVRFCAYLESAPDNIRSVCIRCGIHDERVYNYVHQIWRERMQADPAVQQKFHWLMSRERQTLNSTGNTPRA